MFRRNNNNFSLLFALCHWFRYFSQIDKQLLNELLNIYGPDFDLFDYDSTKYYGIVQTPTKAVASTTIHGTNQPQQQQQPPMNKSA